jgi:hypothetical protein
LKGYFAGKLDFCKAPLLLLAASSILSSCGIDTEYRLRFWEKYRIAAEHALRRKQYKFAHSMALEAVAQAEGLGKDDFRLGVSLCDLGDVEKAQEKGKQAESSYKRAIKVLQKNEPAAGADTDLSKQDNDLFHSLATEDLANCFYQLADLYIDQQRYSDAAKYFSRAAAAYKSVLRATKWTVTDSPLGQKLVAALVGLAKSQTALNNYAAADSAYSTALQIAMASNYPEFSLRELRNEYLTVSNKLGKLDEAKRLKADEDWEIHSVAGMKAYMAKDFDSAEPLLNQALADAHESVFSTRRLMRSLSNLSLLYSATKDMSKLENVCSMADSLMQTGRFRFDKEYDSILCCESNLFILSGRPQQAINSLNKQLDYRRRFYGPNSIEICQVLASKGLAEFKLGARNYASEAARLSLRILKEKFWNNRAASRAMLDTATLFTELGDFQGAEQLELQIWDMQKKHLDKTDSRLISHEAALFVFYAKFARHDNALQIAKDMKQLYLKGTSNQRVQGFPYLVLMLSFAMVNNWFDVAEIVAETGRPALSNDMTLSDASQTDQYNWTKDIARLEQSTGKTFH